MKTPHRNIYGRYTPDQEAEISDQEELIAEEAARIRPVVLEERMTAIRKALAVPGSDVATITQEAWFLELIQNQLETLARVACTGTANENIGRAFRVVVDQVIGVAAQEGLDEAVDERARSPYGSGVRILKPVEYTPELQSIASVYLSRGEGFEVVQVLP